MLLRHSQKIELKKFCYRCGRALISYRKIDHYDSTTGNPVYHEFLKCTVNPISRIFCGHTEVEIDENGEEVEYYDY